MKKYIIVAICTMLMSPLASINAHAESGRGSEGEVRGGVKINLFGNKDRGMDSEHDRAEAEAKMRFGTDDGMPGNKENKDDRGLHLGEYMRMKMMAHKKFDVAVERLEKIIVRVESRIAKMKTEGKSIGASETFIASAKVDIADAKTIHAQIKAFMDTRANSTVELTDAEKTQLKDWMKKEKEELKSAFDNIVKAVQELRNASATTSTTANSTTTVQ